MGNFKFGLTYSSYTPTCANEDTTYAIANLSVYSNTKRHTRTKTSSASLYILDRGDTVATPAIFINDVNFTTCVIMGNASSDFATPTVSATVAIPFDERTQTYKLYHQLTTFDYRYIGIRLPNAMAITDTNTVYRIGSIFCISSETTATKMPTDYDVSADETCKRTEMQGGWTVDMKLSDQIWEGTLNYYPASTSSEAEFWTLNKVPKSQTLVFWEGDTTDKSKAYACKRRSAVEIKKEPGAIFTPSNIVFREV